MQTMQYFFLVPQLKLCNQKRRSGRFSIGSCSAYVTPGVAQYPICAAGVSTLSPIKQLRLINFIGLTISRKYNALG